jgi:response regulator of citrate/malate metabolism
LCETIAAAMTSLVTASAKLLLSDTSIVDNQGVRLVAHAQRAEADAEPNAGWAG